MRGKTAAGALGAGLGAGLAGGAVAIGRYYATVLLDPTRVVAYPERVLGVGDGTVTLATSRLVRQPGVWGLRWTAPPADSAGVPVVGSAGVPMVGSASVPMVGSASEGLAVVGDILRDDRHGVRRRLLSGPVPPVGPAVVDAGPYDPDPGARGLEFTEVTVDTPLGPAPAWEIPAERDVWAIAVHGRGGRRREALRILPTLHALGLPTLVISYRNDDEAPPSPDGAFHLGDTEWEDLEAAVGYARGRGARRIVLVGWSMGAAISGAFLDRSPAADLVDAVVWDAPLLDWRATLRRQARNRLLPPALVPIAEVSARRRIGIDFDHFDLVRHPPARRPPTLVIHSVPDTAVPIGTARTLAARSRDLDWPVRLLEVDGVEHTGSWNADPERYDRAVTAFLTDTL
ncbi:alpha/beta hydrolase family protein [Pseudonocardia ailaonensis]|uniref:alpha/beta hydrolase family protein n=1 Tax=Pseudonocardia ailaonensis TaxID=367279 RepID=UPI0031D501B1